MGEMKEMEEDVDVSLPERDWLENLSEDPYYRGLQDKVPAVAVYVEVQVGVTYFIGNQHLFSGVVLLVGRPYKAPPARSS